MFLVVIDEVKNIRLEGIRDFHPVHIFDCGQAFRWNFDGEGYAGIVGSKAIRVLYAGDSVILENCTMDDYKSIWEHYFDFNRDYSEIKGLLSSRDPVLKEAVRHGWGIRILNQDPWETLVSFIISANNNIARIKKIIERLCECFGEPVSMNGREYYTFPSPKFLADAGEEALKSCGCGYRAPYIEKTSRMVLEGGMPLSDLKGITYAEAYEHILKYPGVGPKVADCILLFSLQKGEAFPVDVWVKRVMEHYYAKEPMPPNKIKALSASLFGEYAGLAQQYLFYYAREQKIGKKE